MSFPPLDPALAPDPDANVERVAALARMRAATISPEEREQAISELTSRIEFASGSQKRLLQLELRRVQEST